ncbi:MAG: DUF1007 family protein [Halomonas sp.]|jgi:ABC-type uncharacterized transport system substrate-binding protein|uniref:DUF1007 family protein n=1 Tax=Billgrantia tianxiuensis TaxID=2497861 RepID=A0A6I6SM04_9GAMM|nr:MULTISPECIES: DUF1007 family protein [Halomonas]MCE8035571.1 DUF1007 family protein [Halomonas sp. MCCC 1A11057]MDX5433027.1 DUF1007 family protein [Halomonas sp.]MDX5502641.1 DUF1007 family protein [Halomonas sp.]QHC51689.1 DUF1007 family protein [Halomonas tianxiuensis]
MTRLLCLFSAGVRRARLPIMWVLVLLPGWALAHPHGWIDIRMRLIVDEQGRLEALHQAWRMDPFYSLVLLEELSRGEGGLEAGLDRLGGEIRGNLAPFDFFTEARLGDDKLSFGEVNEYTVMERGGRVEFVFLLPLDEAQPLNEETLQYQVFDPTYYLEVVHEAEGDTPQEDALTISGAVQCSTRIMPADPDPELVMQAAMLDVDDEAEPGLGRHFAETGVVKCE